LDPQLNEDHVSQLREKSRIDMAPFKIRDPPRIVKGESSEIHGQLVRNLVAG
jgi:hypothetical protein